jgi:hypothetical protein
MAVNFLSSTAINLSGSNIGSSRKKGFCDVNGFFTQLFIVQSRYLHCSKLAIDINNSTADYWVLIIAVSTFLILSDYKHLSCWIQDHRIVMWAFPWFLPALWAAIGLAVVGYGDIGACKSSQISLHSLFCLGLSKI